MARPFDIGGPSTALRLYLILICCAARGETVTYDELAQRAHQEDKHLLVSAA
jgi:O6-methylguanine-DNA--protein-cysteine methyltransferase